MKRLIYGAVIALLCLSSSTLNAQAFDTKTILISGGMGFNSYPTIVNAQDGLTRAARIKFTLPLSLFNFKTEFAVHRYWGVGVLGSINGGRFFNGSYAGTALNLEAGAFTNFHLYQLIADRSGCGSKMHSDKLDIYIGGGLGVSYQMFTAPGLSNNYYSPYAEFHVGVRYQVTPKIGVFAEAGMGQSIFNMGIVFKLGIPKKKKIIKEF